MNPNPKEITSQFNEERKTVEVFLNGTLRKAFPWPQSDPPTPDEMKEFERLTSIECKVKIPKTGAGATLKRAGAPTIKRTQRQEFLDVAAACKEAIETDSKEEFRIDEANPSRLVQWQKSFATLKAALRFSGDPLYDAMRYVSTERVPQDKSIGEDAYLRIIPTKPKD